MNDKCKYCDYVSKCSRICEYNSYLCKVHRSFPKVVDKSYEQLQQENKKLNGAIQTYDILLKVNGEENKQLKDNWNKLKERLINQIPTDKTALTKYIKIFEVLDIMQKLEQGSDSNENNNI